MLIVVGLGNPGPKYASTRHNVGFRFIDLLAKKTDIRLNDRRAKAVLGEGRIAGQEVVLAKPRTFMNNSGEGIEYLLARFGGRPSELLVVYDEMALQAAAYWNADGEMTGEWADEVWIIRFPKKVEKEPFEARRVADPRAAFRGFTSALDLWRTMREPLWTASE